MIVTPAEILLVDDNPADQDLTIDTRTQSKWPSNVNTDVLLQPWRSCEHELLQSNDRQALGNSEPQLGLRRSRYFRSRMFPSQGTGNASRSKARSWKSASVKFLP
jgi:hypothetical protein